MRRGKAREGSALDLNEVLTKVDRYVAWALLFLSATYMISGYMLTRGFISRHWGFLLHTDLALPITAVFSTHLSIRLKFSLLRWGFKDGPLVNLLSLLVGALSFAFVVYLALFFGRF